MWKFPPSHLTSSVSLVTMLRMSVMAGVGFSSNVTCRGIDTVGKLDNAGNKATIFQHISVLATLLATFITYTCHETGTWVGTIRHPSFAI